MCQVLHPKMKFYTVLQRPSKRRRLVSNSEESSSISSSDIIRASTVRRRRIETEVEDDNNNEDDIQEEFDMNWSIPLGNQTKITLSNLPGINTCQSEIFACTEPHSFTQFLFSFYQMKYSKLSQIRRTSMLCKQNQNSDRIA